MPTADAILFWATSVANEWRWLATWWHFGLAVAVVSGLARSSVSQRWFAFLSVLPVSSVAVVAWVSGNPFNGVLFTLLTAVLLRTAMQLPTHVALASAPLPWVLGGLTLMTFGWLYPHFLITDTPAAYVYASPFGVLPCPTLSVLVGVMLAVGGLHSAGWNIALTAAGVLYGWIGVFRLGVMLDGWLLGGAILLGARVAADHIQRHVRATADERSRRLPGDELIPHAIGTLTHATTIGAPPTAVWPWLVQMGAGSRAGWYSYDFLDNGRRSSARRIVPALQHIAVGTVFPALPHVREGFVVLAFEPRRSMTLGWPGPDGSPIVTWTFLLEPQADGATRLIVRARGGEGYRFHGLPLWLSDPAIRLVHFVMQRKQLLGLSRRVMDSAVAPSTSSQGVTRGVGDCAPGTSAR